MFSQPIQAKEQKCLAEHIKQIENKSYLEYQHKQRRDQTIPNPLFQIDILMIKTRKI